MTDDVRAMTDYQLKQAEQDLSLYVERIGKMNEFEDTIDITFRKSRLDAIRAEIAKRGAPPLAD